METFICLAAGFWFGCFITNFLAYIAKDRNGYPQTIFFGGLSMAYVFYKVFL